MIEITRKENDKKFNIIIVSGRSGSGKTSAINILEDFGYYAIDNLPLSLVSAAIENIETDTQIRNIALGVDVRTLKADLSYLVSVYQDIQNRYGNDAVKIIYITSERNVLVARFDATRRVHPLMTQMYDSLKNIKNLLAALDKESEMLLPVKKHADIIIDTSKLNIHQLRERLRNHLGIDNKVSVNVLSFGFKHGLPLDADFVFDVRILPNPHWEENLRSQTGLDKGVQEFFKIHPEVDEMATDITTYLQNWLPKFLENNRYTVTIAIGCTGGKHRSVFITEQIAQRLKATLSQEMQVYVMHREKKRWLSA